MSVSTNLGQSRRSDEMHSIKIPIDITSALIFNNKRIFENKIKEKKTAKRLSETNKSCQFE